MKRIIYIILCMATATCAEAQTVLTLDQCVNAAVSNNLKLRRAGNDVTAATEQRKEAFTKYFPTLSATGAGMTAKDYLVKMSLAGMNMGFVKNGVMADVSLMQPVFAGGQIVNGNRLARVGEEVSQLQHRLTENEVRLTAETYFWQIAQLKEKLTTIGQLERQISSVRNDAQNAVDAGVRNRNDLLQVQLRHNEILSARIQVQNALSVMKDLLAQYIGSTSDSVDISFSIPDSAALAAPAALYASPETSLSSTSEYQLLGKQVEAQKLNYRMAVGKNLPTLAVGGAYTYNNLMDKDRTNLVGMVTLSVPISSWWGGSHDMKRQKLSLANAESELSDNSQLLIIKMRKAWNDLNDAYRQTQIAWNSVTQSEENLRLNTDYYQAGTATMSELLDAQSLYRQSRDSYVEACTAYAVKTREYLQATGR